MHRRRHRNPRYVPLALVALGSALALAACGGSSRPKVTTPSGASRGTPSSYAKSQLAAARCIRRHGLPDFPDPTFGAGGAQVNLHMPASLGDSPAFALAQKACAKLGLELAGYAAQQEKPTAAEMAQWLAVSRCMRAHGVQSFPDPATTMPPDPATYPERYTSVGNTNGVIFAIPKSVNPESPAVKQAATTCDAQALTATG